MCAAGAPEAARLLALGLAEGEPSMHPGQGTACRRFFFANAYLELLFVTDEAEARSDPARSTRLYERWSRRGSGASPFGVVLRPGAGAIGGGSPSAAGATGSGSRPDAGAIGSGSRGVAAPETTGGAKPPFPSWSYRPPYLPPGFAIEVAAGTPLDEPEIFYIPFARRPDVLGQQLAPGVGLVEITAVGVGVPGRGARSAAARAAEASGTVAFAPADDHLLTLTFDGGARGGAADLRPGLPVVLRW
jgi:hypothetical protein